ncbi:hypothetical protein ACTFIT_006947 [Dictyostelium discoideum]
MSVNNTVNELSIKKHFVNCFQTIITSISSISNLIGGIATIKDIRFANDTLTYVYNKDKSYFTSLIMYNDLMVPRTDMAPNYFNCSQVDDTYRYCVFHSDEPLTRLWGTLSNKGCARDVSNPTEDCTFSLHLSNGVPKPLGVKYSKHPSTDGGEFLISGKLLYFNEENKYILTSAGKGFNIRTDMSNPSSNCNNITVYANIGSGKFTFRFNRLSADFPFSYASPIISSIISDPSKQIITINVQVYFDGVIQNNFNITERHVRIEVNDYNRVEVGPMSVNITVDEISSEKKFIHCFPAIITSISSVSNLIGGIVTIKGSKLSSTSLIPIITIGDQQCEFIKSTTSTELECKLSSNESGGKNLPVNINFGGCNSTSSSPVTFSYNIPKISSGSYLNGIVTLAGSNLGSKESSIQLNVADGTKINITQFNVTPDEKTVTFKIPLLKCASFNIIFTRADISINPISIPASLSVKVINGTSSVSNGTIVMELYYVRCPIHSLDMKPTMVVGKEPAKECSIPSLQLSTSGYYRTICPTPFGTGMNKRFTFKYNFKVFDQLYFTYEPPNVKSCSFSRVGYSNLITIHGNNFGNTISLIKVYLNGEEIKSNIISLTDNQITLVRADIYESGPIDITVNALKMQSSFYLILPPIIFGIINKDSKTLSCGGLITISGKNFNTTDEFKVNVFANNQNTTIFKQEERVLIVRANSKESSLNVTNQLLQLFQWLEIIFTMVFQ